jgi:hypothetical protein
LSAALARDSAREWRPRCVRDALRVARERQRHFIELLDVIDDVYPPGRGSFTSTDDLAATIEGYVARYLEGDRPLRW